MAATEDFWQFSLRFYAAPSVPAICLDLQDRLGADVNILLYLLFRAAGGVALTAREIASLEDAVAAWRTDIVKPLRAVRRSLKAHEPTSPAHAALRASVKGAELEAERLEQMLLETSAPAGHAAADAATAARSSVAAYLGSIGAAARAGDALLAAFGRDMS